MRKFKLILLSATLYNAKLAFKQNLLHGTRVSVIKWCIALITLHRFMNYQVPLQCTIELWPVGTYNTQ